MTYSAASTPPRESMLGLSDGRKLGYAEWGDMDGAPVFLFHGNPGSRLLCPSQDTTAEHHVRLVVPERPGYGNSDPKPGRWLGDWADDVGELADALGIERFGVIGWSGGGPHALACGARIPDRVTAIAVVASPGPTDEVPGIMASDEQRRMVYEGAVNDRVGTADFIVSFFDGVDGNDGARWYEGIRSQFPDDPVHGDDDWRANFVEHVTEGLRAGGVGRAEDAVAGYGPWGFEVGEVKIPVTVSHGARDPAVARAHFDHLTSVLPQATSVLWEDGTHTGIYPYWETILTHVLDR